MREELEEKYPTLHLVGRNGMHRYNNQDHAMMTAMLTVRNIEAGERIYDTWQVNEDAEYHEAGNEGAQSDTALGDATAAARNRAGRAALSTGERAALSSLRDVPTRVSTGESTPDGTIKAA